MVPLGSASHRWQEGTPVNHEAALLNNPHVHAADHDLTGQIMWPAAQLLADYLASNTSIMAGCPGALELGSGLGFPGILAAQACPTPAALSLMPLLTPRLGQSLGERHHFRDSHCQSGREECLEFSA